MLLALRTLITESSRLDRFVAELNEDGERVSWATRPITDIELVENYRSTQAILDWGLVIRNDIEMYK
ncbi:hypothetical protein C8039_05280 [Halogeometricum sp. wsp3]|nr:hypothetical protein C8039_05280 [Halogeometricum sp. wsp3]